MTGTEKQVAWAEDIKAAKMAECRALIAPTIKTAEHQTVADIVLGHIESHTDASWWIDRRSKDAILLLQEARRETK